jgi:hypothetical protein
VTRSDLQRDKDLAANRVERARRAEGMTTGRKVVWITFVVSIVAFGASNLMADAGQAPWWVGPVLNVPLALSFLCLMGGVGKR